MMASSKQQLTRYCRLQLGRPAVERAQVDGQAERRAGRLSGSAIENAAAIRERILSSQYLDAAVMKAQAWVEGVR